MGDLALHDADFDPAKDDPFRCLEKERVLAWSARSGVPPPSGLPPLCGRLASARRSSRRCPRTASSALSRTSSRAATRRATTRTSGPRSSPPTASPPSRRPASRTRARSSRSAAATPRPSWGSVGRCPRRRSSSSSAAARPPRTRSCATRTSPDRWGSSGGRWSRELGIGDGSTLKLRSLSPEGLRRSAVVYSARAERDQCGACHVAAPSMINHDYLCCRLTLRPVRGWSHTRTHRTHTRAHTHIHSYRVAQYTHTHTERPTPGHRNTLVPTQGYGSGHNRCYGCYGWLFK